MLMHPPFPLAHEAVAVDAHEAGFADELDPRFAQRGIDRLRRMPRARRKTCAESTLVGMPAFEACVSPPASATLEMTSTISAG